MFFNPNIKHIIPKDDGNLEKFREETEQFISCLLDECALNPCRYSAEMLHDAIENRMLAAGREWLGELSGYIWDDMKEKYSVDKEWDKDLLAVKEAFERYREIESRTQSPQQEKQGIKKALPDLGPGL